MDFGRIFTGVAVAAMLVAVGLQSQCTRIETGEVGIQIKFDKQVDPKEALPGEFKQTLIGRIVRAPVKDVAANIDNLSPIAKDNSTVADFDMTVIYNITPSSAAELYSTKSSGFHYVSNVGTYLMFNYVVQAARNGAFKAVREYEALVLNDKRAELEQAIKRSISDTFKAEGLDTAITVNQVLIRQITPAKAVTDSANALVRAKNEYNQKEVEVKTAEAEARRMQALANQGSQSIAYMQAKAQADIAEGIKNGKVNTVVVPYDFRGQVVIK